MFSLYHMFRKHNYLLDSDKLDDTDKAAFREYEQGLFHDEEDKVEKVYLYYANYCINMVVHYRIFF